MLIALLSSSLLAVLAIVAVHVLAAYAPFAALKRGNWQSFAGGAAAAYVFLHVLPLLSSMPETLAVSNGRWPGGEWVFVAALAGTCAFLALDGRAKRAGGGGTFDFWAHTAAFSVYNLLVGYMLVANPYASLLDTLLYQAALVLHFAVIDQISRERHPRLHDTCGRWIMAASVLIGWGVGHWGITNVTLAGVAFAFLAGGMILNVLKEELSTVTPSRLTPFLAGAALFGAVFLLARAEGVL